MKYADVHSTAYSTKTYFVKTNFTLKTYSVKTNFTLKTDSVTKNFRFVIRTSDFQMFAIHISSIGEKEKIYICIRRDPRKVVKTHNFVLCNIESLKPLSADDIKIEFNKYSFALFAKLVKVVKVVKEPEYDEYGE